MTDRPKTSRIDVEASQAEGLRELIRCVSERVHRELRYKPSFTGAMSFALKFNKGVPVGLENEVRQAQQLQPIKTK